MCIYTDAIQVLMQENSFYLAETYLEPCETSKIESFEKTVTYENC